MDVRIDRFGDWDKASKMVAAIQPNLVLSMRRAQIRIGAMFVREIKKGIVSQSPGGQTFAPLSPFTIEKKGSSKALIDTGLLLSSIVEVLQGDQIFVGLLRGKKTKDGDDLVNIGAIMEFGATITLNSGVTILIPARPFLQPTMQKYIPVAQGIMIEELGRYFK